MKLFSIYDSKAEAHVMWMTNENQDTMQREIQQRFDQTPVQKFAEDYTLFEIALLDEATGKLVPHDAPRSITNLLSLFPKRLPDDGGTALEHHKAELKAMQ